MASHNLSLYIIIYTDLHPRWRKTYQRNKERSPKKEQLVRQEVRSSTWEARDDVGRLLKCSPWILTIQSCVWPRMMPTSRSWIRYPTYNNIHTPLRTFGSKVFITKDKDSERKTTNFESTAQFSNDWFYMVAFSAFFFSANILGLSFYQCRPLISAFAIHIPHHSPHPSPSSQFAFYSPLGHIPTTLSPVLFSFHHLVTWIVSDFT